jgi:hypothetical protein
MHEYNYERPHSALGDRTPIEFKLWRATLLEVKQLEEKPADVGVGMCF